MPVWLCFSTCVDFVLLSVVGEERRARGEENDHISLTVVGPHPAPGTRKRRFYVLKHSTSSPWPGN